MKNCANCSVKGKTIFCSVNEEEARILEPILTRVQYSAGQTIPLQKGQEQGFLCISEGKVKLSHAHGAHIKPVKIVGDGETIGFEQLYQADSQFATAVSDVKGCFFNYASFLKVQDQLTGVSSAIVKSLCQRIASLEARISALESHSVKARVASALYSLKKKFGKPSEHGIKIDLKLDRKTLAELSGTVIETLARTLTEFENDGIIVRQGRSIHVASVKKLLEIAHG